MENFQEFINKRSIDQAEKKKEEKKDFNQLVIQKILITL